MWGALGRLTAKVLEKVGLRTIAKVGAEEAAEQVVKEGAEQAAKAAATHAAGSAVGGAGKAAAEEAAEKAAGAGVHNTFNFHGPNASVSTGSVTHAASEAPKTGFLNWAKSKIGWKTAGAAAAGGYAAHKVNSSNPLNGMGEGAENFLNDMKEGISKGGAKLGEMGFGMGSVVAGVGLAALGALIPGGGLLIAAVLGIVGLIAGQGVADAIIHTAQAPEAAPDNAPKADKPAAPAAASSVEVSAPLPTPPAPPVKGNAPAAQR